MDISEAGVAFIKEWEGFEAQVYDDVAGYGTIGYGHKVRAGERFGTLTEAQADTLLRADLARFVRAVNNSIPGQLTQNQWAGGFLGHEGIFACCSAALAGADWGRRH